MVARQGERDAEQPLDDPLVDLPREVEPLLQLVGVLLLERRHPGHRRERRDLPEDPQQLPLGIVHRLGRPPPIGEDHAHPVPAGAHRRADDRRRPEQPDVLDRQLVLEVVGALDHLVDLQRPAGERGRLDGEEVLGEHRQVDSIAPGRPDPPPGRVVAEDHRPGQRRHLARHLTQPSVERVGVRVDLALGQHLGDQLDRGDLRVGEGAVLVLG